MGMLLDIGASLLSRAIRQRAHARTTGPIEGALIATGAALLGTRRHRDLGLAMLVAGSALVWLTGARRDDEEERS